MRGLSSVSHRQIAAALALVVASSCSPSRGERELLSPLEAAHERLQGQWRLAAFTPERELGGVLQSLLGPELRIVFVGDEVGVTGVGSDASLPFSLSHPTLEGVTLHVHTDGGITYDVVGKFVGDIVEFRCVTEPWRGTGTLSRP